jgi:hypothetical protein
MADLYVLDGKTPILCNDALEWFRWLDEADRYIAKTQIGDAQVSTYFVGYDHDAGPGRPPLLFEMKIVGGLYDNEHSRCATWEEAETLHANAVAMVRANLRSVPSMGSSGSGWSVAMNARRRAFIRSRGISGGEA